MDGGQFLVEYASGKNAEVYPDDTGVLLQAGKKAMISYHLHSIGEEVEGRRSNWAMVLYPEGLRAEAHSLVEAARRSRRPTSISRPARIARIDGYTVLEQKCADHVVPAAHAHPRQAPVPRADLSDVGPSAKTEIVSCANFNYNWHMNYNYEDDVAPIVPAGTHPPRDQLARQLHRQQVQPRSEELGRRRSAHDRRDGLRLDRLVRPDRRGVQGGDRGAQGRAQKNAKTTQQQQQQQQ